MSGKRYGLAFVAVICILASACAAWAQEDVIQTRSSVHAINTGDWEFGILLGEPTGLSLKYWTTWNSALDFGAAWSFRDDGHFHIHADYLIHNFDFIETDSGDAPVYFGIGGRLRLEDEDSRVGIRLSIGIEYIFESHPMAVFIEIAPIIDIAPETEGDVNGGVGIRYVF